MKTENYFNLPVVSFDRFICEWITMIWYDWHENKLMKHENKLIKDKNEIFK